MRTSVVLPDELVDEIRERAGEGSLSEFVRESVRYRLEDLRRRELLREMEAGYRAEAEAASLDPEWADVETEGL